MRLLGILFVFLILFAIFGSFRGWFTIATANASDRNQTRVLLDHDKVADDARRAAAKVGELSDELVAAFKNNGHTSDDGTVTLDAEVKAVDVAARRIDLRVNGDELQLQVPEIASITAAGQIRTLADVTVGQQVRLTMTSGSEQTHLTRIELR